MKSAASQGIGNVRGSRTCSKVGIRGKCLTSGVAQSRNGTSAVSVGRTAAPIMVRVSEGDIGPPLLAPTAGWQFSSSSLGLLSLGLRSSHITCIGLCSCSRFRDDGRWLSHQGCASVSRRGCCNRCNDGRCLSQQGCASAACRACLECLCIHRLGLRIAPPQLS